MIGIVVLGMVGDAVWKWVRDRTVASGERLSA
jgi:hypothetical protein